MSKGKISTTGELRTFLANAILGVNNGDLQLDKANVIHKLAKNISESLYSETKIAMFRQEVGQTIDKFGSLPLGDQVEIK